jgi:hypothetical protein
MSEDAAIRRGISGQVPDQFADNMVRAANGGIVAFALGGGTSYEDYQKKVSDFKFSDAPTPEKTMEGIGKFQKGLETAYGPSQLDPYVEEVKQSRRENKERGTEELKGLTALQMARALGKGPTLKHVLGETFGVAGDTIGKGMKDIRDADKLDRQAEIALVGANQARKDGMTGKAAELNTAHNMMSQKAEELRAGLLEKGLTSSAGIKSSEISAGASKYATDVGAAVQRENINRPGERERQLAEIDKIKSGTATYMGLKGEEGVAAYLENEAKLGAAKFGIKYVGADPVVAQQSAIAKTLAQRGDYDDVNSSIAKLETKEKLSASESSRLNKLYATKKRIEAEAKAQHPLKGDTGANAGKTISMADIQETARVQNKTVDEVRAAAAAKGYTVTN